MYSYVPLLPQSPFAKGDLQALKAKDIPDCSVQRTGARRQAEMALQQRSATGLRYNSAFPASGRWFLLLLISR